MRVPAQRQPEQAHQRHLHDLEHQHASVLPPISTERGSAVAPSRLSTPYLRSKPVPIARPVNAAHITASARMLGTTKSMRRRVE